MAEGPPMPPGVATAPTKAPARAAKAEATGRTPAMPAKKATPGSAPAPIDNPEGTDGTPLPGATPTEPSATGEPGASAADGEPKDAAADTGAPIEPEAAKPPEPGDAAGGTGAEDEAASADTEPTLDTEAAPEMSDEVKTGWVRRLASPVMIEIAQLNPTNRHFAFLSQVNQINGATDRGAAAAAVMAVPPALRFTGPSGRPEQLQPVEYIVDGAGRIDGIRWTVTASAERGRNGTTVDMRFADGSFDKQLIAAGIEEAGGTDSVAYGDRAHRRAIVEAYVGGVGAEVDLAAVQREDLVKTAGEIGLVTDATVRSVMDIAFIGNDHPGLQVDASSSQAALMERERLVGLKRQQDATRVQVETILRGNGGILDEKIAAEVLKMVGIDISRDGFETALGKLRRNEETLRARLREGPDVVDSLAQTKVTIRMYREIDKALTQVFGKNYTFEGVVAQMYRMAEGGGVDQAQMPEMLRTMAQGDVAVAINSLLSPETPIEGVTPTAVSKAIKAIESDERYKKLTRAALIGIGGVSGIFAFLAMQSRDT